LTGLGSRTYSEGEENSQGCGAALRAHRAPGPQRRAARMIESTSFWDTLNPQQRAAVTTAEGPLLVIAGRARARRASSRTASRG